MKATITHTSQEMKCILDDHGVAIWVDDPSVDIPDFLLNARAFCQTKGIAFLNDGLPPHIGGWVGVSLQSFPNTEHYYIPTHRPEQAVYITQDLVGKYLLYSPNGPNWIARDQSLEGILQATTAYIRTHSIRSYL